MNLWIIDLDLCWLSFIPILSEFDEIYIFNSLMISWKIFLFTALHEPPLISQFFICEHFNQTPSKKWMMFTFKLWCVVAILKNSYHSISFIFIHIRNSIVYFVLASFWYRHEKKKNEIKIGIEDRKHKILHISSVRKKNHWVRACVWEW